MRLFFARHPVLVRRVRRVLAGAALIYALVVALCMIFENQLIFHPLKYPSGSWKAGPEMTDVLLTAADGTALHGWYCPAPAPTRAVVLFLHGNGGNLTNRRSLIEKVSLAPADVFAIDYRGYGRSAGTPTEQGVYEDADAAWKYLTVTRHVPPGRIVVFGESLGGAVAIDLARRVHPAGLIVQSSFTSMPDMARHVLPFVPRVCVRSQFNSLEKIREISCPKLFVHSRDDGTVPYQMGRRLYDAAPGPKEFFTLQDASHNDTERVGGYAYYSALRHFVAGCVPPEETR